jgi:multimeric flavodoxin WrbA
MNIAIILGSQRKNGTSLDIEHTINTHLEHQYDFIRMSEIEIEGCIACEGCGKTGKCILPENKNDSFDNVLLRLKKADAIIVISPIYSPYPSRLVALMERLLSISYFGFSIGKIERPLKNKKMGIICYGSSKIEDEKQLKLLFQKYLMDDYSFTEVSYNYLNKIENPNEKYRNVCEYVDDVLSNIS